MPVSIRLQETGNNGHHETRETFATTFIAETSHPAYAGRPSLKRELAMIRGAKGTGGANLEYVVNTLCHLQKLGIRERPLERLMAMIGRFAAHGSPGASSVQDIKKRALSHQRSWRERPSPRPGTVRDNRMGHRAKIAELRDRAERQNPETESPETKTAGDTRLPAIRSRNGPSIFSTQPCC